MVRIMRPLAVFGVAGGVSLAAFHLAGGAQSIAVEPQVEQMSIGSFGLGGGYDLARLDVLESTLYYVEENYVEPARVDYERMFVAALESVERRVPVTMFRREPGGTLLHVEVGDYRTVLEVAPVHTRKDLQGQLREIAKILEDHLEARDIPTDAPTKNPYAEVEYALVNGVLSTLDPHSVLLPPEDSKEMDVENQGEFGGLGVTIVARDGRLVVEYPLPGTPAERAGLQSEDVILRVDGESTINMPLDEAVTRLRGPVNTPVHLEVQRDGVEDPFPVTVIRDTIKLNPVEAQVLEGAIGYVSIKSFHAAVESDLHKELSRLTRETGGLRGLVLDLRGNPGGYLTQAVAVADTFLERGMIVAQVNGDGTRDSEENAHVGGTQPLYPMVVLVNATSASASEIVAGALRNNDRAVILGERSFGKGSVQNLHAFVDESKLKLTISKYLTPGDHSIQSIGIPADIELVPTVAELREGEAGAEDPLALVHWRERVRREVDLDKHLEVGVLHDEEPAYSLRYLRSVDRDRSPGRPDVHEDYEVQFARDVLLSAPSWRRAEILATVAPVVSRHQRQGQSDIEAAMQDLGIDWRPGQSPAKAEVSVQLDLGEDGRLVAGTTERIGLEITNTGTDPLYRAVVVSESASDVLDGREFVVGYVPPGETRRFEQRVTVADGYPAEHTAVTLTVRDDSDAVLATSQASVPVQGHPLPQLAWSWSVSDTEGGDGDGLVEVGETLAIELKVENIGAGPTSEAFARIENLSRTALDIVEGTLEIGTCADAEETEEECAPVLAAGEAWQGSFRIRVNEDPGEALGLELSIGDAKAYDLASIVRGGFYSYFANEDDIRIPVDAPVSSVGRRSAPSIQVTRKPEVTVQDGQATLSGVVTDDVGVAYVMVFHGEDKVFYDGSGRHADVRSVPYTASVRLEPGVNTLTVLAADHDGFVHSSSVVTTWVDGNLQASLDGAPTP